MFSPSPISAPRRQAAFVAAAALLWLIAALRIVSTYHVFSQTFDEAPHVAAGMEWLVRGRYTLEFLHPPLARVAVALGPFLSGARPAQNQKSWIYKQGNQILSARGQYSRTLALARLGALPFFLLGTIVVCIWSWKLFGKAAALLAVLLVTTLPPVLAHAGLATTDLPVAATLTVALLAFAHWLKRRTLPASLVLGLAIGSAIVSKFSALLFLPACGLGLFTCHWLETRGIPAPRECGRTRMWTLIGAALLAAFLALWGVYRFSYHTLLTAEERPHPAIDRNLGKEGKLHDLAYWAGESVPVPAPEFFRGVRAVYKRNSLSAVNYSYLLGKVYRSGKWYFFPAVLAFKSPIPFLLLSGIGMVLLGRRAQSQRKWSGLAPGAAAIALLVVCLPSRINLGVRHILAVYPLLAITAGFGAASLWNSSRRPAMARAAVIGLLLWQVVSSARIHPDYLAYFNELAGSHPDRILVDSDLDWGQDLLRLADTLHARGIEKVSIAYFGTADLTQHNLPAIMPLVPGQPATGWIAISETALKMGSASPLVEPPHDGFSWVEAYQPVALVGRSIRLYYVPPGRAPE